MSVRSQPSALGSVKAQPSATASVKAHSTSGSVKAPPPRLSIKSPICTHCGEAITDVVVQAMDKTWHQDHFLCDHCQRPISSQKYHVHDGKPYCEADYATLFLRKCTQCKLPIRDVVVMALGLSWHKEHFTCAGCETVLAHKGFYERDHQPYCAQCFESTFCPSCHACSKPIVDQAVIALSNKYHVTCFCCDRCSYPIRNGNFKLFDSKPVCESCYNK